MQKKTKSLLEELQSMSDDKDVSHVIESRATNVIVSAIHLIEFMQKNFSPEKAELLEKKLLSAIKGKDKTRFTKSLRKKNEGQ